MIIFGWLIFLSVLTALSIIVMLTISLIPQFRMHNASYGLNENAKKNLFKLLKSKGIGVYFQLMLIKKNENMLVIQDFLEAVVKD